MKLALFETLPGFGGGNVYQKNIVQALQSEHDVQVFQLQRHRFLGTRLGKILHAARVFRQHPEIDVWICTFLPTIATLLQRPRGRLVSLLYHVDEQILPLRFLSNFLTSVYLRQARSCDTVVTIAKYWQEYLNRKGVPNTHLVYWGFDASDFDFQAEEIAAFRTEIGLKGKPIIYLGNCQPWKGVVEAYHALETMDAHLVTSGNPEVQIPAMNFQFNYGRYRALLAAADVVLTMSKFKEGWNATAHEAMLAGTPVIGSGLGGMRELLEGGGQQICPDFSALPLAVAEALRQKKWYARRARSYAREFTLERFHEEWQALIARLDSAKDDLE